MYSGSSARTVRGLHKDLQFEVNYYSKSEDWTDLLEYMFESARCVDGKWYDALDGSEITEQTIMENDYVNKVGNVYIFVSDIA